MQATEAQLETAYYAILNYFKFVPRTYLRKIFFFSENQVYSYSKIENESHYGYHW